MPKRMSPPEFVPGGRDRARDVAVGDQPHPRAGLADLLDERVVAVAVEDHGDQVAHRLRRALGERVQVLGRGRLDVDRRRARSGRRRSSPCRRRGPGRTSCRARTSAIDREGAVRPLRSSVVPSTGSTAMSTSGRASVADPLPVEEHRRLVLLALADDDDAVHRDRAEHDAHGVDGRIVGARSCRPCPTSARRHRGCLGDADQVQGEVAVRRLLRAAASTASVLRDPTRSREPEGATAILDDVSRFVVRPARTAVGHVRGRAGRRTRC